MTRESHLAGGREVATVRNFLQRHDGLIKADEILAVVEGGTLTAHALRTLLAEHDAYRSEALATQAVRAERDPGNRPPAWAYDLLIAVLGHEDTHGNVEEGHVCFGALIDMVPPDQIEKARAIDDYWRQKEPTWPTCRTSSCTSASPQRCAA